MPYKKNVKKSTRKNPVRRTLRTRYNKSHRGSIARLPRFFPDKMITTMRYATTVRLDASTLNPVSTNFYSCNSIYDPDHSGVGHQPMGYDQFENLYVHYKVLSSSIRATFLSNNISSTGHQVCGILVTPDSNTVVGDFDSIRERRQGKYKITSGETQAATITHGFNSSRMYPGNVANVNASFGASPTEQAYFCVYTTSANPVVDASTCDIVITITYKCLLWERKKLAQS